MRGRGNALVAVVGYLVATQTVDPHLLLDRHVRVYRLLGALAPECFSRRMERSLGNTPRMAAAISLDERLLIDILQTKV